MRRRRRGRRNNDLLKPLPWGGVGVGRGLGLIILTNPLKWSYSTAVFAAHVNRSAPLRTSAGSGGSASNAPIPSAKAPEVRAAMRPYAGSVTTSPAPPASVMTIGVPHASASTQALARPSDDEASAITSAAPSKAGKSPCGTEPSKRTRSRKPSVAICASSAPRSGPSPAISKVAPGSDAIAPITKACPLRGISAPSDTISAPVTPYAALATVRSRGAKRSRSTPV